jgi:4-amino-4-deoxy-L-arabinose transferase-like glycosyltransferase
MDFQALSCSGVHEFPSALDAAILMAATALTRFAFRSHYLYDIDSVNFALALKRFDPSVHQPHPPGYFLYVYLGRLVNLIFHDANAALVAISIVFSCGAAAMIYVLADNWFGRNAALFAGLIFRFSPLAWFHGTVALTYIVEAFFSALTGYLCWRIYCGAARFILPGAL